jgi:hypothetical protein
MSMPFVLARPRQESTPQPHELPRAHSNASLAHGAGVDSGVRAAACLATDTYPHMIPISPGDALLTLRKSIHDLTRRPARDYNYLDPPAFIRFIRAHRLTRATSTPLPTNTPLT